VGESRGTVHRINFRSTELRTLDNRFLIVPNKEFITSKVMNWTGGDPKVRTDIDVSVAYGSDVPLVKKVMLDVAQRDGRVRKRPLPDVLLKAFGESSIDFTVRVWLNRPDDIPTVSSDLRFSLHAAFERSGIQMPFPQRDIHLRSAEPLTVRVEGAVEARGELSPLGEPTGGERE
jgi:small-conductance mechanosensitive channel